MKKFTCGHCGGRIAVTPKHLGKLVVCPECGKHTHPLAADILASAAPASPPTPPASFSGELFQRSCENCGRVIGRLEPLQVWSNHLVCPDCYDKLATPARPAAAAKPARGRRGRAAAVDSAAAGPLALPSPVTSPGSSLPVVVERADLARRDADPMAGLTIDPAAVRVAVGRVASAASTVANLPPLKLKHRLLILLGVVCFTGVAIYGALSLLRDLAGLITTLALILLAAVAIVGLLRTGLGLVGRWRTLRKPTPAPKEPSGKRRSRPRSRKSGRRRDASDVPRGTPSELWYPPAA